MSEEKINVLFVDDEEQILKAIRRSFGQNYNVILANGGKAALDALENHKIDIIVSDMRMPMMDGYQLLKIVKEKYPNVIRLILSGYMDESIVFKAIQNGLAKLYLVKPWDNQQLQNTIQKVFKLKNELRDDKVMTIINNLTGLSITKLYGELCQYIEMDKDMKDISQLIEKDPSIASRVLRLANSAFYGVRTGSVHKAVVYLGLANIKNLVLTTSITNQLNNALKNSIDIYWKHASLTNNMMLYLYTNITGEKLPDTYASAGLLHDIGKIALLDFNNKGFDKEISSIIELEESLRISHEMLGGALLEWWNIPLPIVEAAFFHHNPLNPNIINKKLVCIVHIASYYSKELLQYQTTREIETNTFDFLGISQEYCEDLILDFKKEIDGEGRETYI